MAIFDRMSSRNSLGGMPFFVGTLPSTPAEGARRAFSAARRNELNVSSGIATGYWNAMNSPMRARSSASFPRTHSPLNRMSPQGPSYLGWPMSVFANVLLPEPFGPMSAWISPFFTWSESPFKISLPSTLTWRSFTIRSAVCAGVRSGGGRCWGPRAPPWGGVARGPFACSGREALPAGAGVLDVRVVELESGAHQALDVVDLGAAGQHHALEVDDEPDAVRLDDLVAGDPGLAELHEIGVPRTAAAAHADAQADVRRAAPREQLLHLVRRNRRERDHRRCSFLYVLRAPLRTTGGGRRSCFSVAGSLPRTAPSA